MNRTWPAITFWVSISVLIILYFFKPPNDSTIKYVMIWYFLGAFAGFASVKWFDFETIADHFYFQWLSGFIGILISANNILTSAYWLLAFVLGYNATVHLFFTLKKPAPVQ